MMAGPTTQASTPIGTVTDAQMARIFVKEYCLVSAASRPAPATAVCSSYLSVARKAGCAHRPKVPTSPPVSLRADDAYVSWMMSLQTAPTCQNPTER